MAFSNELELQASIREAVGGFSRRVISNPGEGTAVLRCPRGRMVMQTVSLVEGVHFDLSYTTPRELGHRALATVLSALATTGAKPLYVTASVGLRQDQGELFVGEVFSGLVALGSEWKLDVVGESTFASPSFVVVHLCAVGEVNQKFLTAEGARPGDRVYVTGTVGASVGGLTALKRLGRGEALRHHGESVRAHLLPRPRVDEAMALLRAGGVTAVMDLKDGLARDFYRLLERSRVGGVLEEATFPVSETTKKLATYLNHDYRAWALYGGEDFQLLFTVRPKQAQRAVGAVRKAGGEAHPVGQIAPASQGIRLRNLQGDLVPLLPRLWSHFARRS